MVSQREKDEEQIHYQAEHPKTNWSTIIVQAIAQLLVFGGLAVGYVVTNERWKGGMEANLANLVSINVQQSQINDRLRLAIDKLNDNIQILSRNQERVIALLESHMADTIPPKLERPRP